MSCREVKEIIQLYMDNELDARSTLEVQRHIESCPGCSHLLETYLKQDQALKQSARSEMIDSNRVRENILAAIAKETRRPKIGWLLPAWKRVAVIAILAVSATFLFFQSGWLLDIKESVYAAVAADHADHCSIEAVMGAITDSQELNRLAAAYGKMGATPDLSRFGYVNPRGRTCKVDGIEFLHLVYYNQDKQPLSLFVRPHASDLIANELTVIQKDNYEVASISRSGVDLLIVSSLDEKLAEEITRAVAAQL